MKSDIRFNDIFTYEHLYASYRKCLLGVRWKRENQKFVSRASLEITKLLEELYSCTYKSKPFREFDIMERGKPRHIRALCIRDRVVQRCLCDFGLVPVLSKTLIYDCGATIKGKGTEFTRLRLTHHLRKYIDRFGADQLYILTFDFSKYFDNIDHTILKEYLQTVFKDQNILDLLFPMIDQFGERGLGLGSQISQILALTYASPIDHYIKETLRVKGYGRYMDDGYLISSDKEFLNRALNEIEKICDELHIVLNRKKTHIHKLTNGFNFMKMRIFATKSGQIIKKLPKDSAVRARRKFKKLQDVISEEEMVMSFNSWKSYAEHFNSYRTIKNIESDLNTILRKDEEDESPIYFT